MSNYLLKYKGKYRILAELDQNTNDFVRDINGNIDDTDVYISCQNGCKIFLYGHINNTRPVWLQAYIPSIIRAHNIIKALKEKNIMLADIKENDEEVEFKFKASDIEVVADLMKARTSGASISPFSVKNLPSSDVEIPTDKIARYKEITSVVPKNDLLSIHRITTGFLDGFVQKKSKKSDKNYSYASEMKKMRMSRQVKEFIYIKGFWNEYLDYLKKELEKIYNNT